MPGMTGVEAAPTLSKLLPSVPHPYCHALHYRSAFFSFGEGLYGGVYYDTQSLENVLKPECLLASEMNGAPLTEEYGAPLRLRVENQLGYKMVKWIERIEFIESEKQIGKGEGGTNEDDEYFDLLPNI
jgi:methionine sulfoxide reductase catalytic subunit